MQKLPNIPMSFTVLQLETITHFFPLYIRVQWKERVSAVAETSFLI